MHVSQRDGFNSILKLLCGRAVQATERAGFMYNWSWGGPV